MGSSFKADDKQIQTNGKLYDYFYGGMLESISMSGGPNILNTYPGYIQLDRLKGKR